MPQKTKEYLALKNLLHNELGMTKDSIKDIAVKVFQDEARAASRRIISNLENNPNVIKDVIQTIMSNSANTRWSAGNLESMIAKELSKTISITLGKIQV
jgi:hypothetical protein